MDLVVGASSDAVKSLVGKLGSLLAQEYTLIKGVRDDIQYINDELASMQAFLNRTKRAGGHDEQRQDWMKQVREVSYDIEDCIDDVNHRLGHEPRGAGALVHLHKAWYLLKTICARRSIATEISNLKVRAQHVSDRRGRYGVENLTGSGGAAMGADAEDAPADRLVPPPQLIGTKQPVGVEGTIHELGERWFHNGEHHAQEGNWKRFLAIVGFGGLGKTTLALELYRKFGGEFDCRASVQASQKIDLLLLLRSLVKQFHEQQAAGASHSLDKIDEWEQKALRDELTRQLQNKRDLSCDQLKKICKLHQLKYLSMRQTDIDEISTDIDKLEYLEVLDIRETKVRRLPRSIESLKRMAHLLAGNKHKRVALQLTEEITKMTTLETLSGVEIRGISTASAMVESTMQSTAGVHTLVAGPNNRDGCSQHCRFNAASKAWSKGSFQDLEKLTNLRKLSIYILRKLGKSDKESLLCAIEHLSSCSLKSLAIDDDFTGFLEHSLNSSEAPPEHLHSLELSGMLSKVPKWIERLHSLEKLTLSLTSLTTNTLEVLSDLPELFSLTFSLDALKLSTPSTLTVVHRNTFESGGEIFVPIGGFDKLKPLRFMAPILPPISFPEGAMPVLERLELKFRVVDGVHGLENLASLREVFLTVSGKAPKAAEEIKGLVNKIEKNPPTVIVNEYNQSSTEQ